MKSQKVVILGAGISGLSLGWYLKKKHGSDIDLKIIEKESRAGGWIKTINQDGFLFEMGPRSCRSSGTGRYTLQLVEELGLQDQLIRCAPCAKKRYLYIDQALHEVPSGLRSLLKFPYRNEMLRFIIKDFCRLKNRQSSQEESIFNFFSRRLSPLLSELFGDSIVNGIFAGDSQKLSLKACFPFLFDLDQNERSLLWGLIKQIKRKKNQFPTSKFIEEACSSSLFSFKNGLSTLIDGLAATFKHELLLNETIAEIQYREGLYHIKMENGGELQAHEVISTLPTYSLSKVMSQSFPNLARLLSEIVYASVKVVHLGYQEKIEIPNGFGYLIPKRERKSILGVVWDSSVFPEQSRGKSQTRLTVMLGGEHHLGILKERDDVVLEKALKSLNEQMEITAIPTTSLVSTANRAIPQYNIGHLELVAKIHDEMKKIAPSFHIMGTGLDGISVNESIKKAYRFVYS